MTDRTTGPDNPKAQLKGGLDLKAIAEAASHQLAIKPDLSPEVAAKVETTQTLAERAKAGAPEAPQKESNFIAGIESALSPQSTLAEPSLSVPGLPAAEGATLWDFVSGWISREIGSDRMPDLNTVHPATWAAAQAYLLVQALQDQGYLQASGASTQPSSVGADTGRFENSASSRLRLQNNLPTGQDAPQGLNPPSSANTEIGD